MCPHFGEVAEGTFKHQDQEALCLLGGRRPPLSREKTLRAFRLPTRWGLQVCFWVSRRDGPWQKPRCREAGGVQTGPTPEQQRVHLATPRRVATPSAGLDLWPQGALKQRAPLHKGGDCFPAAVVTGASILICSPSLNSPLCFRNKRCNLRHQRPRRDLAFRSKIERLLAGVKAITQHCTERPR